MSNSASYPDLWAGLWSAKLVHQRVMLDTLDFCDDLIINNFREKKVPSPKRFLLLTPLSLSPPPPAQPRGPHAATAQFGGLKISSCHTQRQRDYVRNTSAPRKLRWSEIRSWDACPWAPSADARIIHRARAMKCTATTMMSRVSPVTQKGVPGWNQVHRAPLGQGAGRCAGGPYF